MNKKNHIDKLPLLLSNLKMQINWHDIDTVLLDMDGTLLDRHFDDHFWLEHVPARWAARNGKDLAFAREHLYALFRSQENTLNWTDLDYWSDRLRMDIPLLKKEVAPDCRPSVCRRVPAVPETTPQNGLAGHQCPLENP